MNIKKWFSIAVLSMLASVPPVFPQGSPQSQTNTNSTQSTTTSNTQSNQKKADDPQNKAPEATPKPRYYTNSAGQRVQSPTKADAAPSGATAQCRDGSYSFSQNHRGTCSHHGGVAKWL
jgi:hypothetical protein